jgi:pyruvate kinase
VSIKSKDLFDPPKTRSDNIIDALAKASSVLAEQMEAAGIVAFTKSGNTPIHIAKYRPNMPIIALTSDTEVAKSMSIVWGVTSIVFEMDESVIENFDLLSQILIKNEIFNLNDCIVIVAGLSKDDFNRYNFLKVYNL